MEQIKIFIGSGEASAIERKVLIYSIRKNTSSNVEINVFNGTHNSLERENEPPVPLNMSLRVKYKNFTEFSNYRFLIPELCNYQGRAIFMDSDTICIGDLKELYIQNMNGFDFLATKDAYSGPTDVGWGLSVMLIDCAKAKFDIDKYFDEIEEGKYSYTDLHQMSSKFLKFHPFDIGTLDHKWNDFDHYDINTRIIHFTNLFTQPWKHPGHKFGKLWFGYFHEARKAGFIANDDIHKALYRSYVRQDLTHATHSLFRYHLKGLYSLLKRAVRRH